ncbi:MAG: dipeptide epimerase [SAR324 cluster bacterium]|nr:dipeptide epimerase [SAR324 cluster bacterium]
MKITKVTFWTEQLKLTVPYTIAFTTFDSVEIIFVVIETENGLRGIGAASPSGSITGEGGEECRQALTTNLEKLLLGKDARQIRSIYLQALQDLPDTPSARGAIDIALYDLLGKSLNLPICSLLGRVHESLPTSVTIGIMSVEEAVKSAKEFVQQGFKAIKVKIGKEVERDIAVLKKIREGIGKEISIRTDANQGYDARTYQYFLKQVEDVGLELVEQPLGKTDLKGMATLPAEIRAQTMADESLIHPVDGLLLASEPKLFGKYNIKLMKCGGISSGMRIADIAQMAGIELMWGCNDESIVSITAALHAAYASPATKYIDLDGCFDLERDFVSGGFELVAGHLKILDKPGLGVELLVTPHLFRQTDL